LHRNGNHPVAFPNAVRLRSARSNPEKNLAARSGIRAMLRAGDKLKKERGVLDSGCSVPDPGLLPRTGFRGRALLQKEPVLGESVRSRPDRRRAARHRHLHPIPLLSGADDGLPDMARLSAGSRIKLHLVLDIHQQGPLDLLPGGLAVPDCGEEGISTRRADDDLCRSHTSWTDLRFVTVLLLGRPELGNPGPS